MAPSPPRTFAEAVESLLSSLSTEQRALLQSAGEPELIDLHFTLGMAVRNAMRVWDNDELLRSVADEMRPIAAAEIRRLTALAGSNPKAAEDIQLVFGRFLTQASVCPDTASAFILSQVGQRLRDGRPDEEEQMLEDRGTIQPSRRRKAGTSDFLRAA